MKSVFLSFSRGREHTDDIVSISSIVKQYFIKNTPKKIQYYYPHRPQQAIKLNHNKAASLQSHAKCAPELQVQKS